MGIAKGNLTYYSSTKKDLAFEIEQRARAQALERRNGGAAAGGDWFVDAYVESIWYGLGDWWRSDLSPECDVGYIQASRFSLLTGQKEKKHERNKMDLAGSHCDIRRASMTEKKPKKIVLDANENEFVRASEVC